MVTVVGAVGIDLVAVKERFLEGTSNPSDIRLGLGGVGWRIFSSLEVPRRFITALGADPISRWAREALEADGDAVIQEARGRDSGPPLYLALMESGSLKVGASDFRILEESLSPDFVERNIGAPGPTDFLVLDANLSPTLLEGLVRRFSRDTRIVFQSVSVEKAQRHARALRGIYLVTSNAAEMSVLAPGGTPAWMNERGIAHVVVTRGDEGVTLFSGDPTRGGSHVDIPGRPVAGARDTTGAGDLLTALVLNSLQQGADMEGAVRAAMRSVEERLEKGAV
jgi:sugar/nucleoside kinase (ribokinase family)